MTDRELLEMAAKAAGYEIQGKVEKMIAEHGHYAGGFVITNSKGGSSAWNPLTDDGDALRLAVKLEFSVDIWNYGATVTGSSGFEEYEEFVDDHCAATRRAIVRAAAEIGKNL